jgi:hypothetical protein
MSKYVNQEVNALITIMGLGWGGGGGAVGVGWGKHWPLVGSSKPLLSVAKKKRNYKQQGREMEAFTGVVSTLCSSWMFVCYTTPINTSVSVADRPALQQNFIATLLISDIHDV